jgi:outer membrane protein, multidrug efflux system
MKKTLLFLPFLNLQFGCVPSSSTSEQTLDEIAPATWVAATSAGNQNSEGNQTYWIKQFEDPNLNRAIRKAWISNPNLLAMAERVLASGEGVVVAGANLFPSAKADLSGSRSKRNLIGFNFPNGETSFTSESFNAGINLSWELDLWGKLQDYRHSARTRFQGTQAEYESARLSLAGQIAKAWFEIIESEGQLRIARSTSATYSQNKAFIEDRFEKGLNASALDNDLAEATLASAKANLARRNRAHQVIIRKLELLLGEYPAGIADRNHSGELPRLSLASIPPSPTEALEKRPDLKATRLELEASGIDVGISRKNLLPSIAIVGGPGSRSGEFENLLDQRFRIWEVSAAASQPLFQAGRLRAQIRKTKALRQAAEENYKAVALKAFSEVENALSGEQFLRDEELQLEMAAKASEAAAKLSWERYRRGVESIFNTLDAQRRAFEAESRLLFVRKERIFNRINLYLALGMTALPENP